MKAEKATAALFEELQPKRADVGRVPVMAEDRSYVSVRNGACGFRWRERFVSCSGCLIKTR